MTSLRAALAKLTRPNALTDADAWILDAAASAARTEAERMERAFSFLHDSFITTDTPTPELLEAYLDEVTVP